MNRDSPDRRSSLSFLLSTDRIAFCEEMGEKRKKEREKQICLRWGLLTSHKPYIIFSLTKKNSLTDSELESRCLFCVNTLPYFDHCMKEQVKYTIKIHVN